MGRINFIKTRVKNPLVDGLASLRLSFSLL
jgi:hypothetical protein